MQKLLSDFRNADLVAKCSAIVIALYVLCAIFAPALAFYQEAEVVGRKFEPWSAAHWLGTDQIGRDVLSRLIYGARNTIGIALTTTAVSFSVGVSAGLIAAVLGGWVDTILSRVVDVMLAVPSLILALLLLALFGTSVPVLIGVIAIVDAPRVYRISRAVAMNIVVTEYIEVAAARGEGLWWIIRHEVLPNAMPPLLAEFGLRFGFVFLFISSLSFLGVGLQPPTADWGTMVRESAILISFGDVTPLIPALAIAVLTVSVNFLVNWFLRRASGLND